MNLPLSRELKNRLRQRLRNARSAYIRWRYPFGPDQLLEALRRVGVREGDTLLVHSAFHQFEGFQGSAMAAIGVLQQAVGPSGLLLMPTLPFSGSAARYATEHKDKVFDPRTTPSRTGILTELFRRSRDVVRSLHPTHAVAAWGRGADDIIEGHHLAATPCGEGTPYHRLLEREGKVLLAGVSVSALTFFHTIEEIIEADLPSSPFTRETFTLRCRRADGEIVESAPMRLFDPAMSRRRNIHRLVPLLRERSQWHETRVGRLGLTVLGARHALDAARELARRKVYCYEAD
jgi:aminoglycoside 3-N-acetyltransferase